MTQLRATRATGFKHGMAGGSRQKQGPGTAAPRPAQPPGYIRPVGAMSGYCHCWRRCQTGGQSGGGNIGRFRLLLAESHWETPRLTERWCVQPGDVVLNKLAPVRAALISPAAVLPIRTGGNGRWRRRPSCIPVWRAVVAFSPWGSLRT
jgi:hypothetical protein